MNATIPAVRLTEVTKSYGATRALTGVSLDVAPGTVHALVGENGAGKSTALGIVAGRTAATTGTVEVFGEPIRTGDPRVSRRAGVVAIYQELTIVPHLSAEANVFLSDPLTSGGFLAERRMRARYEAACAELGVAAVPPRTPARRLSVADQQLLEILRAVISDARVILFDEPTASLAVPEREALFRLMRSLRERGVTLVLVSHNLDEVLDIADAVTVFRDGALTVSDARSAFTTASLVQAMLGERADARVAAELLPDAPPPAARRAPAPVAGPPVLRAEDVTVPGAIEGVAIEVRAGEMVGVGGLVGSGRTSLLRALAGLEPHSRGRLWIDGEEVPWPRTVRRALRYGIALVPEDRKTQGLVLQMSSADNIALADLRGATRAGLLSGRSVERATAGVAAAFGLQAGRLGFRAGSLSGGNQQKLLLARWSHRRPRVLLTDEPTRGIDVGAKAEILTALEAMAAEGTGLVMVSSELEEITAVADRVVVLSEGLPAGTLARVDGDITPSQILELAFRVHPEPVRPGQAS